MPRSERIDRTLGYVDALQTAPFLDIRLDLLSAFSDPGAPALLAAMTDARDDCAADPMAGCRMDRQLVALLRA